MAQHHNLQTDYLHQFLWTLLATILHPGSQHAHQDSRTHGQAVLPLRLSHSRQLAEVNLQRLGASHMSIAKALLWRCPLDSLLRERKSKMSTKVNKADSTTASWILMAVKINLKGECEPIALVRTPEGDREVLLSEAKGKVNIFEQLPEYAKKELVRKLLEAFKEGKAGQKPKSER